MLHIYGTFEKVYDFFIKRGIPGPSPTLFFGNFLQILRTRGPSIAIKQWTEKYGQVFGYFEGHTPVLVISNPDILQDLFVTSFSKFHSRRESPFADSHGKVVSLFIATGLRWKRQRFVMNPTFSSLKLKQMSPLIHRSVEIFMGKLQDQYRRGEIFDIYAFFKRFTMDTIWSCGFGLDTDVQNDVNNPYLLQSQKVFSRDIVRRTVSVLVLLISELKQVWRTIFQLLGTIRYWLRRFFPVTRRFITENPGTWIIKHAYEMIEKRRKIGHTQRTDLLQLMLESVSNEDFIQVTSLFLQWCNIDQLVLFF